MRFDVLTLFPELFSAHVSLGVTRRAFDSGAVKLELWPLRPFGDPPHQRVDDRPYGGGPGMVMLVEPLERALAAVRGAHAEQGLPRLPVVHFSPTGRRLDQPMVRSLAASPGAILLCGRYEGVDQRFIDRHVDLEISLGDFVLSGGELPALALVDAIARLQDGVLGDPESHQQDSFSAHLLDCPHYSRPPTLAPAPPDASGEVARHADDSVPPELLSGHHAQIAAWRRARSVCLTIERRPDLIDAARTAGELTATDERTIAAWRASRRGI